MFAGMGLLSKLNPTSSIIMALARHRSRSFSSWSSQALHQHEPVSPMALELAIVQLDSEVKGL
jgi:hypothetical protein